MHDINEPENYALANLPQRDYPQDMNRKIVTAFLAALVLSNLLLCGCGNADFRNKDIFNAVKKNDLKTVKALLIKYPDLAESKDSYGNTPIYYTEDSEVIYLLLTNNADINAKNNEGWTPLLAALYRNNQSEADVLLDNGAEIQAKNDQGQTPLHLAASYHNWDMTEMLISHKADVNSKDNDGDTPLHWASKGLGECMASMARQNGLSTNDWLSTSNLLDEQYLEVAEGLLANKAEVNAKNNKGETPLHLAIVDGEQNMVGLLRQHGATNDLKPSP